MASKQVNYISLETMMMTSKEDHTQMRAFVTFLAGDGDYVKGVVGLAKGLRKAKSRYPLVVAVLPDVPEEHRNILVSQGCVVREIEPVYPPENQTQFAMAYYVINYSKLRIWEVILINCLFSSHLHFLLLFFGFSGTLRWARNYTSIGQTCMRQILLASLHLSISME